MSDQNNSNGSDKGEAPLRTIRDGALSSSVWPRDGEDGKFYTAKIVRNYFDKNNSEWCESSSFTETDLNRLSDLAKNTRDVIVGLRHDDALAQEVRQQIAHSQQAPAIEGKGEAADQKQAFVQQRKTKTETPSQKQRVRNKQTM